MFLDDVIGNVCQSIVVDEVGNIDVLGFTIDQKVPLQLKEIQKDFGLESVDLDGVAGEADGTAGLAQSFPHQGKKLVFCSVISAAGEAA